MTFEELENLRNVLWSPDAELSSLDEWYSKARRKPLESLDEKDLGISLRQEVFLDVIIPLVIEKLIGSPLEGSNYDGELLVALSETEVSQFADKNMLNALKKKLGNREVKSELLSEGLERDYSEIIKKL